MSVLVEISSQTINCKRFSKICIKNKLNEQVTNEKKTY
jgi:hypothetical protein